MTCWNSYISVVLWSGVRFGFIQAHSQQAALDGLQDGLIVRINAYQIVPGLRGNKALRQLILTCPSAEWEAF